MRLIAFRLNVWKLRAMDRSFPARSLVERVQHSWWFILRIVQFISTAAAGQGKCLALKEIFAAEMGLRGWEVIAWPKRACVARMGLRGQNERAWPEWNCVARISAWPECIHPKNELACAGFEKLRSHRLYWPIKIRHWVFHYKLYICSIVIGQY